MNTKVIEVDLSMVYDGNAKVKDLDRYVNKVRELAGKGNDVVLTGQAPVWLYLKAAHILHGVARKLIYRSPVTGDLVIFDHNPY